MVKKGSGSSRQTAAGDITKSKGGALSPKNRRCKPAFGTRIKNHVEHNLELGVYYGAAWAVDYGLLQLIKLSSHGSLERVVEGASINLDWLEAGLAIVAILVFFIHVVVSAYKQITFEVRFKAEEGEK